MGYCAGVLGQIYLDLFMNVLDFGKTHIKMYESPLL